MSDETTAPDKLLRWPYVETLVGISRCTAWRRESEGRFPRRVSLGGKIVAWRSSEIQKYISNPAAYRAE
jgi:prophage regulatory protein